LKTQQWMRNQWFRYHRTIDAAPLAVFRPERPSPKQPNKFDGSPAAIITYG
jgi:hypothetical protein